jgi:arginyl-tRNA synthetase
MKDRQDKPCNANDDSIDLTLTIRHLLLEAAAAWSSQTLESLGYVSDPDAFSLTRPPKPEMGDLAFPCFPLAKPLRKNPAQIASGLLETAQEQLAKATRAGVIPRVERLEPAGPYLNLFFAAGALAAYVCKRVAQAQPPYGAPLPSAGRSTMVEYSAPNTNKPLHLGHVRNNLLGLSLSNILAAAGEDVIPVNLVNDRGIHIAKSMVAYGKWGGNGTPESAGKKGDHFVGEYYVRFERALKEEKAKLAQEMGDDPSKVDEETERSLEEKSTLMEEARECLRKWEEEEPETRSLWARMNAWVYAGFDETYRRLGCAFRKWYFESETYKLGKQLVETGLQREVFERHPDGSVWARLENEGLKDKILLRSDGTSVYITQDIGTAVLKFEEFDMDRSIYVVGSEQRLHFKMLFTLLRQLGYEWAGQCYHLSYGLVTLPHGMGKLKSREGRAVDADDLLDELAEIARRKAREGGYVTATGPELDALADDIGQGALKMYLLQVGAEKNIQFDPDATIDFEGDTGPAVQYSHARICSIVRKGLAEGRIAPEDLVQAELPAPFAEFGTGSPISTSGPVAAPEASAAPRTSTESREIDPVRDAAAAVRYAVGLKAERADPSLLDAPEEKALSLELVRFPSVLRMAAAQLNPAPVAAYLLDLAKAYARFYHNCPVLRAESEARMRARLHLSLAVAAMLRRGLSLLGIRAPDAM